MDENPPPIDVSTKGPRRRRFQYTLTDAAFAVVAICLLLVTVQSFILLFGSQLAITGLSISHDGRRVGTWFRDGRALVSDPQTGQTLQTLKTSTRMPGSVALSPNGNYLCINSRHEAPGGKPGWAVDVWDVRTGELQAELPTWVDFGAAFVGDQPAVVYQNLDTLRRFDFSRGTDDVLLTGMHALAGQILTRRLAISDDGNQLAVTMSGNKVVDIDMQARVKRREVRATARKQEGIEELYGFSADGRYLALMLIDVAGQDLKRTLAVVDWAGQELTVKRFPIDVPPDAIVSVACADDGPAVAWAQWGDHEVTIERFGSERSMQTLPVETPVLHLALSRDAQQLAVGSFVEATLWNVSTKSLQHRLWTPVSKARFIGVPMALFFLIFLWWTIARKRLVYCSRCARSFLVKQRTEAPDLCPSCEQDTQPIGKSFRLGHKLQWLFAIVVLVGAFFSLGPARGLSLVGAGLLVVLAIVASWVCYWLVANLLFWRRWVKHRALPEAQRVSDADGVVHTMGGLTIWLPHENSTRLTEIEEAQQSVLLRFRNYLGIDGAPDMPFTLVELESSRQYFAYGRTWFRPIPGHSSRSRLCGNELFAVYCPAIATENLYDTTFTLRALMAAHALASYLRAPFPYSFAVGMIEALASQDSFQSREILNRQSLALVALGQVVDAQTLFVPGLMRIERERAVGYCRERSHWLKQLNIQLASVFEYLLGYGANDDRRRRMRGVLDDFKNRQKDPLAILQRHFECSADKIVTQWRSWVIEQGHGAHELPSEEQRAVVVQEKVPLIRDLKTPRADRIVAIRNLAMAGAAMGASAIIDLLDDQDELLRQEAVWALSMISGYAHGSDRALWQSWWDSLPGDVKHAESPVESA